jgi:hypothetical protein
LDTHLPYDYDAQLHKPQIYELFVNILPSFACGLFPIFLISVTARNTYSSNSFYSGVFMNENLLFGQPCAESKMNQRPNSDTVLPGKRSPVPRGTVNKDEAQTALFKDPVRTAL